MYNGENIIGKWKIIEGEREGEEARAKTRERKLVCIAWGHLNSFGLVYARKTTLPRVPEIYSIYST